MKATSSRRVALLRVNIKECAYLHSSGAMVAARWLICGMSTFRDGLQKLASNTVKLTVGVVYTHDVYWCVYAMALARIQHRRYGPPRSRRLARA